MKENQKLMSDSFIRKNLNTHDKAQNLWDQKKKVLRTCEKKFFKSFLVITIKNHKIHLAKSNETSFLITMELNTGKTCILFSKSDKLYKILHNFTKPE